MLESWFLRLDTLLIGALFERNETGQVAVDDGTHRLAL
jgi:hypothetical protein